MNRLIQTVAFINNFNDNSLMMLLNIWQPCGLWLKSQQVACSDCYQTCCLCAILFLNILAARRKINQNCFSFCPKKDEQLFLSQYSVKIELTILSTSTFLVMLAGHKCLCYLLLCGGYLCYCQLVLTQRVG